MTLDEDDPTIGLPICKYGLVLKGTLESSASCCKYLDCLRGSFCGGTTDCCCIDDEVGLVDDRLL